MSLLSRLAPYPLFDPGQIALQVAGTFAGQLNAQVLSGWQNIDQFLLNHQFVFSTGSDLSYNQGSVMLFHDINVIGADTLLVSVVFWIGLNVMFGSYKPLEMMSRVVLALVAIHGSLIFAGLFIQVNNGLCDAAFLTAGVPGPTDLAAFLGFPPGVVQGGNGILVFQTIIIIIMASVVILQMLVRLALLDLLIVLSPYALLLYIIPSTQRYANLWASAFFSTLFVQFLQVTTIAFGAQLIASFGAHGSFIGAFAGIALLLLVLRIPGWLGSAVTGALGGVRSPWAYAGDALRAVAQGVQDAIRFVRP